MSRLTKWFADSDDYGHNSCFGGCESCNGVMCGYAVEMVEKLAHYEDLEEQGRLIEQKHGRWKIIGMRPVGTHLTHYCSICGGHGDNEMDYCPHCGAKMDEVENE